MEATSFRFENLTIYRRSLNFSTEIYTISQNWPREHLFGITDQLRRASLSISLNIAEGSSRTKKDFKHFLQISLGSCYECIPLIEMALSLKLIPREKYNFLYNEVKELSLMISSLRSSLKN